MNIKYIVLLVTVLNYFTYQLQAAYDYPQDEKLNLVNTYILAAKKGDLETVKKCLAQKVDINAYNSYDALPGQTITALMSASSAGHENIVQYLLQAPGIDLNIESPSRLDMPFTALSVAAYNGNENIVNLLLAHPAIDLNMHKQIRMAFGYAMKDRHVKIAKQLLQHPSFEINYQGKTGVTVLMYAVGNNYADIVQFLLQFPGIIISTQNPAGETALSIAVKKNYHHIAKLIQDKIEELTLKAFQAIEHNDIKILKQIIDQLGPDIIDTNGNTLIDKSFSAHKTEIVLFLLNIAKDPQEQLARFPFELTNPTSELFKMCMGLAYNSDHVTTLSQKDDISSSHLASTSEASVPAASVKLSHKPLDIAKNKSCAYCSKLHCNRLCGRCKKIYYCSPECQKSHWKTHKHVCKQI